MSGDRTSAGAVATLRRVETSVYALGLLVGLVGTTGLVTSVIQVHRGPLRVAFLLAALVWLVAWVVLLVRDRQDRRLLMAHDATERVMWSLTEARRTVLRNDDPRGALVQGVVSVSGAALSVLSEVRGDRLVATASAGARIPGFAIPLDQPSLARQVLESGQPLLIADIHQEEAQAAALAALEELVGRRLHTVAYVPITIGTEVVGLITAAFTEQDLGLADQAVWILSLLGEEAALAIDRERLLTDLNRLSLEDPLTGLTNRRGWDHALAGLGRRCGLALLDLDHFKRLNDTEGHPAGDRLLKQFALVASLVCRSNDTLARIGGEEFAVLSADEGDLVALVDRLRSTWAATGSPVTFSAGVAYREEAESTVQLQERCDQALYVAKESGRDRTVQATGSQDRQPSHR